MFNAAIIVKRKEKQKENSTIARLLRLFSYVSTLSNLLLLPPKNSSIFSFTARPSYPFGLPIQFSLAPHSDLNQAAFYPEAADY